MKQYLKHLLPALACIFSFSSCEKELDVPFAPFLSIEEESLNFDQAGADYMLEVRCNEEYTVKTIDGLEQWCSFSKLDNGDLQLNISANEEKNVRRGRFCILAKSQADTLSVAQLGWGKAILLSQSVFNVEESGNRLSVDVTANVPYTFDAGEYTWINRQSATRGGHDAVTNTLYFTVKANNGGTRTGEIVVKDTDADSEIQPAKISVIQKGLDNYVPGAPEIGEDIKIEVESVTGDGGERSGGKDGKFSYDNMIDGEFSNVETDRWKCETSPDVKIPQYIEFAFKKKENLDYILFYPYSTSNSFFKDVEIYCKSETDGMETDYVKVWEGQFEQNSSTKRIDLATPQIDVTKVKFILKSSTWAFECKEMEFYSRNPLNFDYKILFKDQACTALLDGITEKDILDCQHSFFKNLAWYMYNDKYPREFRIADYKAYPNPDKQAKINKTNTYSLLDNPTGISVAQSEELAVMADLKGLKNLRIRVQNLDQPGLDGFGGDEYTVVDGINTFKMKNKGLIYVMYHTDNYATAKPVTLHFTSGKVNGYFDSQNPAHEGRWKELLAAATDKHFDVLGKYAHLTFPTLKFMNHTKDGKVLIGLYDELVYREQEFLGLEKYGGMFKNRSYFNVMYSDSYMYSTSNRTSYVESTLTTLCDETIFKANCWGPVHEVGHSNQTRPGLKWIGTTEVTNNIMSQYVQTSVFNEPSRLQVKGYYGKAWTSIIAGEKAHAMEGDVFNKLVPFWQLELYFGKALGQTPMKQQDQGGFYPDVYEYVRMNANPATEGACQLEFVYNCCAAAKADLTDFFEKWGFLRKVDTEIDDYGKKQITVTEADITKLKNRVAALGYSKIDVALEYITDNTVDLYKNKPSVVEGTTARKGNEFTMTNWKNVAAFEVKNDQGNLVYVSEGVASSSSILTFTLPTDWKNGFTVNAVSVTGERKAINVQ